jgi:hypothetical protein
MNLGAREEQPFIYSSKRLLLGSHAQPLEPRQGRAQASVQLDVPHYP